MTTVFRQVKEAYEASGATRFLAFHGTWDSLSLSLSSPLFPKASVKESWDDDMMYNIKNIAARLLYRTVS